MQETEPTELRPVFSAEGVSYIYTQVRAARAAAPSSLPILPPA